MRNESQDAPGANLTFSANAGNWFPGVCVCVCVRMHVCKCECVLGCTVESGLPAQPAREELAVESDFSLSVCGNTEQRDVFGDWVLGPIYPRS